MTTTQMLSDLSRNRELLQSVWQSVGGYHYHEHGPRRIDLPLSAEARAAVCTELDLDEGHAASERLAARYPMARREAVAIAREAAIDGYETAARICRDGPLTPPTRTLIDVTVGVAVTDPPLSESEVHGIVVAAKAAAEQAFRRVILRREEAVKEAARDAAQRTRAPRRPKPKGGLSERAELMLALVRESTKFHDGELTRFFIPNPYVVSSLYGQVLPGFGFKPSGAGDVHIFRALERRGFIREVGAGMFQYAVTPEGIAAYDEIKKRRDAAPQPQPQQATADDE